MGGHEEGSGDEEGGCHEEGCHEGHEGDEGHEGEEGEQRDEEGGDEGPGHEEGHEEEGDRGGMREEQWGRFQEALAEQIVACRCGLVCRAWPCVLRGGGLHAHLGHLYIVWLVSVVCASSLKGTLSA